MNKEKLANLFVNGLVKRFDLIARGADTSQNRFVGTRPDEAILCGFLTPGKAYSNSVNDPELADEDPYSMTSIGLELLIDSSKVTDKLDLSVDYSFSSYIRMFPTRKEQQEYGGWKVTFPSDNNHEEEKYTSVIEVWEKFTKSECNRNIPLLKILSQKKFQIDFTEDITKWWNNNINTNPNKYSKRTRIRVTPQNLNSEEAFLTLKASSSKSGNTSNLLDIKPEIDIRTREVPGKPGIIRISIRLINRSKTILPHLREFIDPNLYDVNLEVSIPLLVHHKMVFRELEQSYLYDRSEYATGVNCDVETEINNNTVIFRTKTIPKSEQKRLIPREIEGARPSFIELSANPISILKAILGSMKDYGFNQWQQKIDTLEVNNEKNLTQEMLDANRDFKNFKDNEINEFEEGINLLNSPQYSGNILKCFKLMNEVMSKVVTKGDSWRIFQIVFIVKMLRELASVYFPELKKPTDGKVDILWFAAGGGKSEAFFGLLVWQMLMDRLQGKTFGVTGFVRFPLRLLTFQQLQRLSKVVAEADKIRKKNGFGGEEFSLGYFVGGDTTPNSIDNELHERLKRQKVPKSYRRLIKCPYCNQKEIELEYDSFNRLIKHRCNNCKKLIPIYIVDYDIYRYLPTIVVSTVDKLANLGQQRRFSNLFGRIDRFCPIHGAAYKRNNKTCMASGIKGAVEHPEKCGESLINYGPFKNLSPTLCIIDELHLLREELGTFDGHYETLAMELQQTLGFPKWKIIAATATIEKYERHAEHLYLKSARRFPGPGPSARETFYFKEDVERIGRVFLGVIGVGKKHTPSVSRALTILYKELDNIKKLAEEDVGKACSILDLPLIESIELKEMVFQYEIVLTYVLTRKGSDQVSEAIENRVKNELINGDELRIQTFNSGVDMADMMNAMESIEQVTLDTQINERIRGVVATSIVSHGVDIERFGIMVFAGLPRMIAEYIQASARIGRTFPGISIFVATPQAERDRSVFDRFGKFHEYLDRLVEPSAINRWPEAALERTIPGAVVAYLMHVASFILQKEIYTVEQVLELYGHRECDCLNEDAIIEWVSKALGVEFAPNKADYFEAVKRTVQNVYRQVINASHIIGVENQTNLGPELGAMRNLRDVDDPGLIVIEDINEQNLFWALSRGM